MAVAHSVTTKHPEWEKREAQWKRMRDVIEGEDAVKAEGTTYLPAINTSDTEKTTCGARPYDVYKENAQFYNTTGLTFEAFIGMIFRKNPVVGGLEPDAVEKDSLLKNVDLEGTDVHTFIRKVTQEVVSVGRVGILIDYPTNEELELTLAEAERKNIRRYAKLYKAEDITNWKYTTTNGLKKVSTIVLREMVEDANDPFSHDLKEQYRVLLLENGKYIQQVYSDFGEVEEALGKFGKQEVNVLFEGEELTDLPFICINSMHLGMETNKPALLDMANTNLHHYRASASLGVNINMFARSTPIFEVPAQYWEEFKNQTLEFGATKSIIIPTVDNGAKSSASFLEPSKSADLVVDEMGRLEVRMAAQGARMLTPSKKGVESANTVRLDMSGELSILASIVTNISKGLSRALSILRGEIMPVDMNSDFMTMPIDAGMISSLLMALQAGRIGESQFIDALVRGEAIKPESTITTDTKFTPSPDAEQKGVPDADGELKGREENVEKGEPLQGPNGLENRG